MRSIERQRSLSSRLHSSTPIDWPENLRRNSVAENKFDGTEDGQQRAQYNVENDTSVRLVRYVSVATKEHQRSSTGKICHEIKGWAL